MKYTLAEVEQIAGVIHIVRDKRVILDSDLARFYGVTTKRLNQQVTRNAERFPQDFSFQVTRDEYENLRLQFATSRSSYGGRRYLPRVFTEHGALMAANVLNSPIAVQASVHVVRAFVRLREMLATHAELAHKLDELERRLSDHDDQIGELFEAFHALMTPTDPSQRKIGFRLREVRARYGAKRAKRLRSLRAN